MIFRLKTSIYSIYRWFSYLFLYFSYSFLYFSYLFPRWNAWACPSPERARPSTRQTSMISMCQSVIPRRRRAVPACRPHLEFHGKKWNIYIYSLDWFKGKSTGNHGFYHQIKGFPVNFPIIQFYEIYIYICICICICIYIYMCVCILYTTIYTTYIFYMKFHIPWRIHGAGIYANIHRGYIDGIYVTIIYHI